MTPEQQRELVVRLATRVMGWIPRPCTGPNGGEDHGCFYHDPAAPHKCLHVSGPDSRPGVQAIGYWNPLESLADAWMLVEALGKRGYHCWFSVLPTGATGVSLADAGSPPIVSEAEADTTPMAICLAADAAMHDAQAVHP